MPQGYNPPISLRATTTEKMSDDLNIIAAEIKHRATELGFDLVGIAPGGPSAYGDYFRRWLSDGRAGTMDYLAARLAERIDPAVYLPGCKSVICVAMNYFVPLESGGNSQRNPMVGISGEEPPPHPSPGIPGEAVSARLPPENTAAQSHGRIARYALGEDYHEIIKPRLHKLADWLKEISPQSDTRCAVDTAPVMEKELAARAGVGWLGKNTCIINPRIGSWLLLGEVLTTLELPCDEPAADHCGTCTRCLDACPTQAITSPYKLDATKCISYLTIEHRGELPNQPAIGDWLYGCDICQDVCPFNRRAPATGEARFAPRFPTGTIDLNELQAWSDEEYRTRLRGSAMKRVKLPMLKRNGARIALNPPGAKKNEAGGSESPASLRGPES